MISSFQSLVDVLRVLHSLDIAYMLVGAFSSNAYSYPRATKDADIVIDYRDGVLTQICSALGEDFQLDAPRELRDFHRYTPKYPDLQTDQI